MSDETIGFIYTFSADTTDKILKGEVPLSAGGTRREDGTLIEMGRPLAIESGVIRFNELQESRNKIHSGLASINNNLDVMANDINEIKRMSWLQYAATCHIYEMSYAGFLQTLQGLELISTNVDGITKRMNEKDDSDNYELMIRYRSNLKSDAGVMDAKGFNAMAMYSSIVGHLDEISAYLTRLFNDLKTGKGDDTVILRSISCLIMPYCYVIRKYSALYYYENDSFPAGYDDWVDIADRMLRDMRFKNKLEYYLRVRTEIPLPEIKTISKKVSLNLRSAISNITFDKKYCLCHTKDEYLDLPKQLEKKICARDYQIIDGHICIELE